MTLSLNPTLTQEEVKEQNKEIQVDNIDIVTQHKPMPTQQENNTESSINTQEPIGQTPNTTKDFDINNKEYQEFVKEFLTIKQTAKDHYDLKYSKDLLAQSIDKFEITRLANPLFIANNIKDMGREGLELINKSGDQIKKSETELYDYLAKTGINHEMLGIKNFDEQKLKDAHIRQGLRGKTEYKQLNEKEKDYLKRQQNWAGALWDKMVHSEEKRVEELLRNDTRRYIDPDLLTDLIKIDSAYSSVLNVMKSSQTASQDLQKKLEEMDIKAKERGYAAAVYDKKAKALAIIDKQGKKYYLDEDGLTANLDKIIVNNWNDILLSSIPVGGWGAKGVQLGAKGAGIALKNAGFKGLGKEAAKAGAISFAASPLDYVTLRKEVGGEVDTTQMLEFSAGNALGSAAGVMAIGTLAKGASKAYNSIKDLKNLSTDDLKNIKISKYLDNEEASIHRKLAKFNKSEIDSNYEIFKGLQSDRIISKEMKDPTFMGNFMDKISDYNVLKHLSSKKESQDKLLSALFSNKELAREFAGKLTSEEAAIVNKAIHAMGENFTRLSKEYEQQIIDEYAKSGKIKGNPHTEMQNPHVEPQGETSSLNGNKDFFTTPQYDNIESKSIQEIINIIETSPQKGRDMQIIGEVNFTPQIIEYAHKNNKKIAIDKLSKTEAEQLGFKYANDVRVTIDYQAINHTLNRYGVESNLVKQSGQKPVEYSDIANYRNIAKTANETFFSKDDLGQDVILSFKQINGHAIIVESIRKKGNELAFKSMYFEKGSYKNSKAYKDVVESQKANHFQAPYGYEPHADANTPQIKADNHIIPQNLPEVYKNMLDEIDKQAKQEYKTSIDNLQNALNDTDFKATLLQGYKQVTDDAIESLGLDNQLTNTLIRETQKLESKPNISLAQAIELRKNINEIMRNYEKSSSDLKKFRANKHLDNIKDNIDNAIKNALDSKVAQNEANQMGGVRGLGRNEIEISPITQKSLPELRQELKDTLLPILNKDIINEQTQAIAQISNKGLKKMMSDKAILKSITNGFTKEEHFAIAKDIENLYKRAKHIATQDDLKGNDTNLKIHRYINEVVINEKPAKVLITAKEYLENGKKIYSVELDKIASVKLNPSGKGLTEYPKSKDIDTATFDAPNGILNPTQKTLTRQEADELFSNFQQANKNYAQIKESLNDKFAKALTKGMNKKDLDSRLTIEQWKQRVLDTQWGDSVKGLENTIFKNFNPRMQKHTQMLTILRALDRNVKLNDDSMPIDFTKILSDIQNLEKLTLHPEIYPILDTFKSYAKSYQFAQEISKAKALENQVGSGALATTLEGRIKVFLTNRLFKKLFAFIPYIGDNAAITKALQSAIKDLKYPSEITLETLKVLNKADLDKGFKPIKDKEPRFEYKAHTPLSDKELQDQIKGNTQILTPKDTSEIEAIASNPLIQNMERQAKYNEELTQKISQFEANKENIQQDILNNLVVATQEIKQNTELLKQLATQLTQNNPIHTPNKSIIKAQIDNETYFITTDKNNITAIEKQEIQNLAQPKTYDELMQRDKNQATKLDSMYNQYVEIAEIKEKEAEKQLLLEYKPEVAKASDNIIGDNFILKENDISPSSQVSINTNMEQWIKNAADISATSIHADLTKLAQKHPEMFKKPSEAFKLFLQIKNNPTHFLENNREDVALIAKMINDKKIGKMGVKKDDGEVVHLTNRDIRPKDNKANPHKTLAVEPPTHYHTSAKAEQGDGAKAHSLERTNDSIKQETNKDTDPITKQQLDQFQILQEAQRAYDKLTTIKYANKHIQKLKESFQNGNRIYSLELEGLTHPTNLNRSPKSKGVEDSHHDDVGATQTTRLFENHGGIIPQTPKDNSDPLKTFEYFKDDFIKAYPKALEFHDGHMPMANYLSHYAKEEIQEANKALFNTAKDEFSQVLKDIGFKQHEMKPVIDFTNKYDIEYSLTKVREYLDYAQKHYDTLPQDQQTLAKDLLKHKQDILNIYESKMPQYQALDKKRMLMSSFDNNAKILGSDEYNLLKNLVDELYIPQTPKEIIKQARKSGKSVKETKELLQKHNKEIQSIRTEIRKDIATRQKNIEQGYIDLVSSHHTKIGKKGGYVFKKYLETDKKKQSYLYDGFNKESLDNYLQLVKENAPLKERNKALDRLVNERLEAEARYRQLQKQQEELEEKQLQAFDEESFIKSLEGKSKDELENIQGDLWSKSRHKNSDIPFPVISRMSNLVMWIKDKIPQAAFNNDELREAIKSLRLRKEYKDDINSIQYFKENRAYIEQTLNIKPIKEFGTNYAEHYHSGETAIQKLINEAQAHKESGAKGEYKGQVAGAFHRKELGDIDLVWGEITDLEKHKGYGLAHILDKRKAEFMKQGLSEAEAEAKAMELINNIPNIIGKGEIIKDEKGRLRIELDNQILGIKDNWHGTPTNKWIITTYEPRENVRSLYTSPTITKDETLPLNSSDIIPQKTLESTMQKFNYDEKKAKDLLEWHKDSSPLTKDENGLPKVFYHGSETDKPFEVFLSEKDQTKWGFWFSSDANDADLYARARGNQAGKHGYKVFLKAKNIFDFNDEKNLEVLKKIFSKDDYEFMLDTLQKWGNEINVFNMLKDTNFDRYRSKAEVFKNELKKLGYDGIKELGDTIVVFDSNQIKHIDNKGSYTDTKGNITKTKPKNKESTHTYFNENSPNIMYANPQHLGSGIISGSVAGIETDENGNIVGFNPAKFAAGFLGGVVGSKAVSSGYKMAKARYYEKNFDKFIDDVNAKKSQMQPRFQVTQELEKSYRENEVKVSDGIAEKLGLKGKVFADYIKLAQKHPEYFANPQEAKALTEYIAQNAKIGIKASKKEYELVFAEIQGGKGVFAIDLEYKGGKHRIRSVHLMKNSQYKRKLYEAKKLGEPILQF